MIKRLTDGYFEGMDSLTAEEVISHFQELLGSNEIPEAIVAVLLRVQDNEFCAPPD